jgi:hypothetical protein
VQYVGATQKAAGKVSVIVGLSPGVPAAVIVNVPLCESLPAPTAVTVLVLHPEVKPTFPATKAVPVTEQELNKAVFAQFPFAPIVLPQSSKIFDPADAPPRELVVPETLV